MALMALLAAQSPSTGGDPQVALSALLPIAGMTVVERQAEAAAAIGVTHALILVDAIPAALVAACDRMRARGLTVTTVRSATDIDSHVAASDRLLLVADSLHAPSFAWATIAASPVPTVLTVADSPATTALERIDAQSRWAGLAMIGRAALDKLPEIPDDWDTLLTLLRGSVQDGAPTIGCDATLFERGDLTLVADGTGADLVELRMIGERGDGEGGLVERAILAPLARAVARPMLRHDASGRIARMVAFATPIVGMAAALYNYPIAIMIAGTVSGVATAAAGVISAFRAEPRWMQQMAAATQAIVLASIMVLGWVAGDGEAPIGRAAWLSMAASLVAVLLLARRLGGGLPNRSAQLPDAPMTFMILAGAAIVADWRWGLIIATPMALLAIVWTVVRTPVVSGNAV